MGSRFPIWRRGSPIPAPGKNTIVEGRKPNPSLGTSGNAAVEPVSNGPTIAEANVVHLAWDIMVGLATLLFLLVGLVRVVLGDQTQPARRRNGSCRIAACCGVMAVLAMEAGWVVTEVGRQPWIVHNYMKVTQAATTNTGVWLTFVIVFAIYAVVGVTTILVLRGMSRRYREAGELDETQVPVRPERSRHPYRRVRKGLGP